VAPGGGGGKLVAVDRCYSFESSTSAGRRAVPLRLAKHDSLSSEASGAGAGASISAKTSTLAAPKQASVTRSANPSDDAVSCRSGGTQAPRQKLTSSGLLVAQDLSDLVVYCQVLRLVPVPIAEPKSFLQAIKFKGFSSPKIQATASDRRLTAPPNQSSYRPNNFTNNLSKTIQ